MNLDFFVRSDRVSTGIRELKAVSQMLRQEQERLEQSARAHGQL
ncbi:hypothetical protein QQF73_00315 [Marinobacter sp. M216]|uniref:Uncharacterized protein n=1 Tax=Marinobacter albus TaxID=3030833 RepID=A0ABT7H6R1_9GAMM|nr:hypothetical protein [Marinobacter sp. M216]MDK9556046.1 hypothetical protein [Marinobacter sp. M216]